MPMLHPAGMLALSLGTNALGVCKCGNDEFHLMVRRHPVDGDVLVATHCTQCHEEQPVPIDPKTAMSQKFII